MTLSGVSCAEAAAVAVCVCEIDARLRACMQAHQAGGDGAYTAAQQPSHAKGLEQCCVVKQGDSAANSVVQARELTCELCGLCQGYRRIKTKKNSRSMEAAKAARRGARRK